MNPSARSTPSVRQRPGDRVRDYILSQGGEGEEGKRLPTMRDLAVHLSVSLATVQNVYRTLKKEGRILTRAGDGTYLVSREASPLVSQRKRRLFFNHLSKIDDHCDSFQGSYYGAVLQALAQSPMKFDFSILDADPEPEKQARALFERGELDAMIIFPFMPVQPLIDTCDREGIPYVTIHPPNPSTSANFVTPDFFSAGLRMGDAFRQAGRERMAVFAYGNLLHSTTGREILSGVANGWVSDGGRVTFEHHSFNSILTDHEQLQAWLLERRDHLPDVILSHRATLYRRVLLLLEEMKVRVPEEVSVVSVQHGDHDNAASIGLTRLATPFEQVAVAAVKFLIRRIEMTGEALPGVKLPLAFAGGATTTPTENRLLGL